MADLPGLKKPELSALEQVRDRISFLYLEHCVLNRADGAITVTDFRGTVHVPAAELGVLLLGPGTKLTHRAIELMGDAGASVIWVGESGVRYYAHGRPLTHSSSLLIKQAELVSNERKRLDVARRMYAMRFRNEDVSRCTMQQLRGREGARVRSIYRRLSAETGVPWNGRDYDPANFAGGSDINKALTVGHACLYGLAHSVIVALGLAPGLGFVHTGHERSFVYDIADLYKAETSIPAAFTATAESPKDIEAAVRYHLRDLFYKGHLLQRMVADVLRLLNGEEAALTANLVRLWDEKGGSVRSGVAYGRELDEEQLEVGNGSIVADNASACTGGR